MVLVTTWAPSAEGETSLGGGAHGWEEDRHWNLREVMTALCLIPWWRLRCTLTVFIFSLYFIHVQKCANQERDNLATRSIKRLGMAVKAVYDMSCTKSKGSIVLVHILSPTNSWILILYKGWIMVMQSAKLSKVHEARVIQRRRVARAGWPCHQGSYLETKPHPKRLPCEKELTISCSLLHFHMVFDWRYEVLDMTGPNQDI
jgi:hypothetical protein